MRRDRWFEWVIIATSLLHYVCGLDLVSIAVKSQSINGVYTSRPQATVKVDSRVDLNVAHEFDVPDDNGIDIHHLVYTKSPLTIINQLSLEGFVPSSVTTDPAIACMVTDLATYAGVNGTQRVVRIPLNSAGARILLDAPGTGSTLPYGASSQTVLNLLCAQFRNAAHMNITDFDRKCKQGALTDEFNQLRLLANQTLAQKDVWIASLEALADRQDQSLQQIADQHKELTGFTEELTRLQLDTVKWANMTAELLKDTQVSVLTANAIQNGKLAEINFQIANISADMQLQITITSDNFDRALAQLMQVFSTQAFNVLGLAQQTSDNKALTFTQMRRVQINLLDQQTNLARFYTDADFIDELNLKSREILEYYEVNPNREGVMVYPMLPDIGLPPATSLTPSQSRAPISEDIVRYITALSDGTPIGRLTRLTYYVDTKWATYNWPKGPTSTDLANYIGPPGCDPTWTASAQFNCRAAVVVLDLACTLSVPTLSQWNSATDPLDMTGTSGCTGAAVPGSLDGQGIVSLDSFLGIFRTVTARGLRAGQTGYRGIWTYLGRETTTPIPFVAELANVTAATGGFTAFTSSSVNLLSRLMQIWSLATGEAMRHFDGPSALIKGFMPNGMFPQEMDMGVRLEGGTTGDCKSMGLAFHSSTWLTVSKHSPQSITSTTTVTVDGDPAAYESSLVFDPYDKLLPTTEVIYWSPNLQTQFVWNTPESEDHISPYYGERAFRIAYWMLKTFADYSYNKWIAYWEAPEFDADWAGHSASLYKVTLDSNVTSSTYGQCIGNNFFSTSGRQCDIREHYEVVTAGVFDDPDNPGTIFYLSRDATMIDIIEIPGRSITKTTTSSCPFHKSKAHVSGVIIVTVTNPVDDNNRIRIRQTGSCVVGTKDFTMTPRQTVDLPYAPCASAPLSTPDIVVFDYFDTSVGGFVPCNSTEPLRSYNLTIIPDDMTISTGLFHDMSNQTTNVVLAFAAQTRLELIDYAYQVAAFLQKAQQNLGFRQPNITDGGFDRVYTVIGERANTQVFSDVYGSATDFAVPLTHYTDLYNKNKNDTAHYLLALQDQFARLVAATQTLSDGTTQLLNLTRVSDEALVQFFYLLSDGFARALFDATNALADRCLVNDTLTTCPRDYGALIRAIGELPPDQAACAPSGLNALFGGSVASSDFFSEMFGGCSKGNVLGPLIILAVAIVLIVVILVVSLQFCPPALSSEIIVTAAESGIGVDISFSLLGKALDLMEAQRKLKLSSSSSAAPTTELVNYEPLPTKP